MILPGFGSPKVSTPPPPPPPPEREDPQVVEARKKLRESELRRRGRSSTMLTGKYDTLGTPNISRPQASASFG